MSKRTLRSRLDKECACALGFKGFKMPASSSTKSGGGGGGGGGGVGKSGGGGVGGSSSPPRVSKERRRFVDRLLLCDVVCANIYVFIMIACSSDLWAVFKIASVPLVFMVRVLPT